MGSGWKLFKLCSGGGGDVLSGRVAQWSWKLYETANNYCEVASTTGRSLSEALISASTNPQYDHRLFIESQVQYMKIPSSEHGRTCCVQKLFLTFRTIYVHMCSPCSAKIRASDKDLPVTHLLHTLLIRKSTFCQKITAHKDQQSPS